MANLIKILVERQELESLSADSIELKGLVAANDSTNWAKVKAHDKIIPKYFVFFLLYPMFDITNKVTISSSHNLSSFPRFL